MQLTEQEQRVIERVQELLGYSFKDPFLLIEALTHRSYLNVLKKVKRSPYSYERLEFLGDSVLHFFVSDYLFKHYTDLDEGTMSKVRSASVNTEVLSKIIKEKGLNRFIFMSRSERLSGGRDKPHILAAVYESLLGALYVDGGLVVAYEWVDKTILPIVDEVIRTQSYYDPKTRLQEITQRRWHVLPEYEVVKEEGLDHAKTYTVRVKIQGNEVASGTGPSKKSAEMAAARRALAKLEDKIKKVE